MKIYGTESTRLVVVVKSYHPSWYSLAYTKWIQHNTIVFTLKKGKYSYEHKNINSEIQMQSFFCQNTMLINIWKVDT